MDNRFGKSCPAENLSELFQVLQAEDNGRFLYRGQTKPYEINVPSALRTSLTGESDGPWRKLSTELYARYADHIHAKKDLRQALMMAYGKSAGNLLSQQYGISSDAFDVTKDLAVASFFASRTYPYYEHYSGNSDNDLGVIYRIKYGASSPTPEEIEFHLNSLQLLLDNGTRIAFGTVYSLREAIFSKYVTKETVEEFVRSRVGGDFNIAVLVRPTVYLDCAMLNSVFVSASQKLQLNGDHQGAFLTTRAWRQSGGMLFPSTKHLAYIPRMFRAEVDDYGRYRADPPFAVSAGAEAVWDLDHNPNVTRFYFRHTDKHRIEIENLETLWPSVESDGVFALLVALGSEVCEKYLKDYGVDILDDHLGLISRGFSQR